MKLVRFSRDGHPEPGVLVDNGVVAIADVVSQLGCDREDCIPAITDGVDQLRDHLEAATATERPTPLTVRLLPPLRRPRTILCAIANYWEHADRTPRALRMYLKNPDAVIGPGDTIELPETTAPWVFMHEAELALVMRATTTPVATDDWRSAVFGYTGLIDVSAAGMGAQAGVSSAG